MAISVLIDVFLGPMNECIPRRDVDTDRIEQRKERERERERGGGGVTYFEQCLHFIV